MSNYLDEIASNIDSIDINGKVPATETERQYYFIAKAREYVRKKSEKLGRPLRSFLCTFGCQMDI